MSVLYTSLANGIQSFGKAYASGVLADAQSEATAMISQATTEYRKAQQEIHNRAADRNAREQTNIVTMNELFVTAEAQLQKQEIQKQAMAESGKAAVLANMSGIGGQTADRLAKTVEDAAALAEWQVDDSVEKQQLGFLYERKAIESNRLSSYDHSLHIAKQHTSSNPLFAGLSAGVASGLSVYSKLSNDKGKKTK